MATIALGIGTSHTPMLSMSAPSWESWGRRDSAKTDLRDVLGNAVTYDDLAASLGGGLATELSLDVYAAKLARTNAALDQLAASIAEAGLDVVVVVGDDQDEHLGIDNLPPVLIYHGETLRNTVALAPPGAPPEIVELTNGYYEPDRDVDYPVDADLAGAMIDHLLDHGFDIASSARLPKARAEGHALQFPHRRLLGRDLPIVPVLLNTYMPPSQPRATRCFDLGVAMAAAVRAIGGDRRVGFLASGGLSHFVVHPEWDRRLLRAFASHDVSFMRSIPEAQLQSGNSECKNWIAVAGACSGMQFCEVDYVPGFRTPAGTGTGLAFGTWSLGKYSS